MRVAIAMELEWPYKRHVDIYAGVMRFAGEQADWECVIDDYFDETIASKACASDIYDGAIGRIDQNHLRMVRKAGLPAVNVWSNSPVFSSIPTVIPDHAKVGRLAAEHLMDRGLREFACLRFTDDRANQLASEAFEEAVRSEGYVCCNCFIDTYSPLDRENRPRYRETIQQWIDSWSKPIGVYISVDYPGRLVAQYCLQKRLLIPEQVAIIAGYNQEIICDQPIAPLTSIEIGFDKVGYQAAQFLDQQMRSNQKMSAHTTLIPPEGVVTRASTDFLAVDDELVGKALKYISSQLDKPISVEDVAEAVIASRATLERRFRQYLNRTVGSEIRRLRMQRAQRLLLDGEAVGSVAKMCGFLGTAQFSRAFYKRFGVTPSGYQNG